MKLVLLVIFLIIIITTIGYNIDITEYNPFKDRINIPEGFIDTMLNNKLKLNSNTHPNNPLKCIESPTPKPHQNLVFISIGSNQSNLTYLTHLSDLWNDSSRQFDIMIVYTGIDTINYNEYRKVCDYIYKRNGTKYQNFHFIYQHSPTIINKYKQFYLLDDTIITNTHDVNKMFDISTKHNLWICSPTQLSNSLNYIQGNILRNTNFIDSDAIVISKPALTKFMNYYNPVLSNHGIDQLLVWSCGADNKTKYAMIDSIPITKTNNTTINDTNMSNINDNDIWDKFSKKYDIPSYNPQTWSNIAL